MPKGVNMIFFKSLYEFSSFYIQIRNSNILKFALSSQTMIDNKIKTKIIIFTTCGIFAHQLLIEDPIDIENAKKIFELSDFYQTFDFTINEDKADVVIDNDDSDLKNKIEFILKSLQEGPPRKKATLVRFGLK